MSIERYLCVGGIEVANPCRTQAYLRNIGTPCLVRAPSPDDCGCCPEWLPQPCEAFVVAGLVPSGATLCLGIFDLGPDEFWTLSVRQFTITGCDGTRPALPPPDDPGWADGGTIPGIPAEIFRAATSPSACPTWASLMEGIGPIIGGGPPDPTACAFAVYELTGSLTGAHFEVVFFFAPQTMDPDTQSIGSSVYSIDGGATWLGAGTSRIDQTATCPTGSLTVTFLFDPQEASFCRGIMAVDGGIGPFAIDFCQVEQPTPPTALPAPVGEPPWACAPGGVVPAPLPPIGGCDTYDDVNALPGVLYSFRIEDMTTGAAFEVVAWIDNPAIAPGDLGGSTFSSDGGVSWAPIPIGPFSVATAAPPAPGAFTDPATDDAPWYDPQVPESADVMGVWIEEAKLASPWKRAATDRMHGASLGPGRLHGRELAITGWLYARTEAATAYGRQWLFEALAGSGCDDDCDLPDVEIYTHCAREGIESSGLRTLKRVGLTAFDPEIEAEFPRRCGLKFSATLTAEIPELFLERTLRAVLDPGADGASFTACNLCAPCPTTDPSPCSCGALAQPPRVVPVDSGASGFCEPVLVRRTVQEIAAPAYWREATAIVTVHGAEGGELANVRLRGWTNPAGLAAPTADADLFACREPCIDLEIACVPPDSKLVIDGTTRRVELTCQGVASDGYRFLTSDGGKRVEWPDIGCAGLMLVADFDDAHTGPKASIEVEVIPRERG